MEISANELNKLLNKEEVLLLDVRTPAEFNSCHVSGAINIPLDKLSTDSVRAILGSRKKIITICQSGKRGQQAASVLSVMSDCEICNVTGGTLSCEKNNLNLIRGKNAISLERQVRIAAGSFVLLGVVLSLILSSNFIFLSAFVGAGLIFSGITDTCGMALILGKMPWNK